MSIKSNVVEEALRLADEPAQPKQAPQTPNAERAREIADALDRVMAERREVRPPLACAAAPPPLHDEAVPMQEYERHEPVLRGVTAPKGRTGPNLKPRILVAVIIAVVMMWPITTIFRSYVERPTPTIPAFDHDRGQSSSEAPQAAQSAPAPLLTDPARTAAGDGLASLPDPNSESLKGPLALPPWDALPPAATPTGPAETAPNAPAVAPGEAAAVTDSAQSVATAETASSEAVTPVQRDRLTATGPATGSIAPVGPVPLPRMRPVDAPVDTPPVPSSPPSVLPLFAHPAAYGYQPGLN
jgi:hypothetical protein